MARSGPSDDELITWWGLVVEAFRKTSTAIADDLAMHTTLPAPWFEVLLRVQRSPDERLPMSQIAADVQFTSGGFTKLADRLVEAGLVERVPCPTDRRVTWMMLTPEGRKVIVTAKKAHARFLRDEVANILGLDRFEELADIMRTLRDGMSDTDDGD